MEGQTPPNIRVIHSVWRRVKKAKIRDLQPIKDAKGGGRATGLSRPRATTTRLDGDRLRITVRGMRPKNQTDRP